jgi:hypothetical protein
MQIIGSETRARAGCLPLSLLAETIQLLSIGEVPPPDFLYAPLAMLAMREIGEAGGTLLIPSDWNIILHRIGANAGESAVHQVVSVLCYMEVRYPGMLVRSGG